MIVWTGRGFLIVIVLILSLFISLLTLPKDLSDYGFIISLFISALFSWFFGSKWNSNKKILTDEKTGEKLILINKHSLFWIPMQYWGIILSLLGILILFQNSLIMGTISMIILVSIIAYIFYSNRDTKNDSVHKKKDSIVNSNDGKKQTLNDKLNNVEIDINKEKIRKEKENPNRFMPK